MNLDELEKLLSEATPGPWILTEREEESWTGKIENFYLLEAGDVLLIDDETYYPTAPALKDAKLISALRNNAEKMVAVIKAAKAYEIEMGKEHNHQNQSVISYFEQALADLESE